MLNNFHTIDIFAIVLVASSIALLIYFAVKTLITSNLFQKGVNLYQQQDYQGAEAAFRQVIARNTTNDMVRLLLGDTLNQQGKIVESKEWFEDVILRSPKNPQAYLRLANVLMQQEQREAAKANLQIAQDLLQKQRQPEKAEKVAQVLEKMNAKSK
ncbi:TPR repeat protein [Tolypothrix tenuis PCC 7101]|uniref:TPR repeat protein n=1 Tax=Tolypothrix tenuis PCC 7101 TaxID=231146 RepID=A0A1Z4N8Q8_9CYAN|nr:tetratricopeptide repeat protein [Aulosira sp. FACHB-113]BAZ02113.1 TPR repeat protein [Tolypothrix tenuis PCC 7101]BAZ73966.1 TPR repeat protein [Aulosira laxa NIES-50]